ncbi:MAG: hypothetical protein HW414_942, partial [Dehalococcoidia bacterium]|nr:hypothetical protein [Dehalococcoidia bacterium]
VALLGIQGIYSSPKADRISAGLTTLRPDSLVTLGLSDMQITLHPSHGRARIGQDDLLVN